MSSNGKEESCAGNSGADQQKPVCKKELAILEKWLEQNRPPPLQMNFRIGVPTRKKCEDETPSKQLSPAQMEEKRRKISADLREIEAEVKKMQNSLVDSTRGNDKCREK